MINHVLSMVVVVVVDVTYAFIHSHARAPSGSARLGKDVWPWLVGWLGDLHPCTVPFNKCDNDVRVKVSSPIKYRSTFAFSSLSRPK